MRVRGMKVDGVLPGVSTGEMDPSLKRNLELRLDLGDLSEDDEQRLEVPAAKTPAEISRASPINVPVVKVPPIARFAMKLTRLIASPLELTPKPPFLPAKLPLLRPLPRRCCESNDPEQETTGG